MNKQAQITIIGGGITGLSSAFYLQKQLAEKHLNAKITVVEASSAFGGKVNTMERDGIVFEKGADSFLARKLPIIELTKELGLENELTGTNPNAKKTYILHRGKLHAMPPGLVLGIPSELTPFIKSSLISPFGKLRAAMDLVLPRRKEKTDESLGSFLERRLGKEVLERIAEPLLAGIYAGNMHALSLQATFPQFGDMEQKFGSLIRGTSNSRSITNQNLPGLPPAAGKSMFLTFRKGLMTLINGLIAALQESGVELRLESPISEVNKTNENRYDITYTDGHVEQADAVIIALPAYQAASLLPDHPVKKFLEQIDYVSVANVVLAFRRADVNFNFDGSGFLVPRSEGRFITACTWTSNKWMHTAPEDKILLRFYVGRSGDEAWRSMTTEEIVSRVRKDMFEIMGLDAEPLFHEVTPLERSMPQYALGHLDKVAAFRADLKRNFPGLLVTGAGFHGVGLPDCVRQGREAADELIQELTQSESRVAL